MDLTSEKESSSKPNRNVVVWNVINNENIVNNTANAPNGFAVNNLSLLPSRKSSKNPAIKPIPNVPMARLYDGSTNSTIPPVIDNDVVVGVVAAVVAAVVVDIV